jgi:hypothetical protein
MGKASRRKKENRTSEIESTPINIDIKEPLNNHIAFDFLKRHSSNTDELMHWLGMIMATKNNDVAFIELDSNGRLRGTSCKHDDLVFAFKESGDYHSMVSIAMEDLKNVAKTAISTESNTIFFEIDINNILAYAESVELIKK